MEKQKTFRVLCGEEEWGFLNEFCCKCKFPTPMRVSKEVVICYPKEVVVRKMIATLQKIGVDVKGVKTEEEIEERILIAMDKLK